MKLLQAAWLHTQVTSQLAAAEKAAAKLKADAARAEVLAGQCQVLNKDLEEAKEGRRLVTMESQKQRGLLERELQSAGKARDQLAEQASLSILSAQLPTHCLQFHATFVTLYHWC